MSASYALAPEFASQPKIPIPSNRLLLRAMNVLLRMQQRRFAWDERITARTHSVPSSDGHVVSVFEISPKDLSGTAPALIDYHGGGFFLSYTPSHLKAAERYALEGRCRVFFPDYRLSCTRPFPAPFDDCHATLAWVHENATACQVDPQRVGLIGDSAGGSLAAGVAQKALDEGTHPVCAQVLIYPATDNETKSPSARQFSDTPIWKTASNIAMWKVYLDGSTSAPPYAAPLHRESFAGLPPAWVEVAEFDPLRDEGRQYAEALEAAGVPVEIREAKGGVHGYDMVEGSPTAEALMKERIAAIQRFLGQS